MTPEEVLFRGWARLIKALRRGVLMGCGGPETMGPRSRPEFGAGGPTKKSQEREGAGQERL